MQNYYSGIGSRETPMHILEFMKRIGDRLGRAGWILRTGGAFGADSWFEKGCDSVNGPKEIYLPWKGYNNREDGYTIVSERAMKIAAQFHPAWHRCGRGARLLHGRNSYIVFGFDLEESYKSNLVICWTPGGRTTGGTGQAIRIAETYRVPVFNLAIPEHYRSIETWITQS